MIQQITLQAIGPNAVMRTHLPCKSGLFSSGKRLQGFIVAMEIQCQCTCSMATPVPRGMLTFSLSEDILRSTQKNNSPQIRMQRASQELSRSSVETILCRNGCCQMCRAALTVFTKEKEILLEDALCTPSSGKSILILSEWH